FTFLGPNPQGPGKRMTRTPSPWRFAAAATAMAVVQLALRPVLSGSSAFSARPILQQRLHWPPASSARRHNSGLSADLASPFLRAPRARAAVPVAQARAAAELGAEADCPIHRLFFINLDRRVDRRARFLRQAQDQGLDQILS
ncbi:unnamed protein product, partial [Polarella glacialis]